MNALGEILKRRILAEGPISIAAYMQECLLHPEHGYYTSRNPLGAAGDFTTAPEISQMFGEMVGLALAQGWLDQGAPKPFVLAEAGPGRGTLMADILRATRAVPGFHEALSLHLIEASPRLRAQQRAALVGYDDIEMAWFDRIADLPEAPLFFVANEFFDALPIRQFQRAEGGWRERKVGLAGDALALGAGEAVDIPALAHRLSDTRPGDVVEVCPQAAAIVHEITSRIARHGGTALIIDYGGWHSLGDTLQAVRDHAPVDVLACPGEADLTAHVDFEALVQARAAGMAHTRLTPQGIWLERLGITERARRLAAGLSGSALGNHISAHRRLTHPEEMGTLFKVLAFHPAGAPAPPGFA